MKVSRRDLEGFAVQARLDAFGSVDDPGCAWCAGLRAAHERVAILEARRAAKDMAEGAGDSRVSSDLVAVLRGAVGRLVHVNAGSY